MAGDSSDEPKAKRQQVSKGSDKPEDESNQPSKNKSSQGVPGAVEEGTIFFLYRPRVGLEEVKSLSDVQRFYMILDPQKGGKKKRLIVIGKKKVPSHRERFFGFVQTVDDDVKKLTGGMGEESHETANGTRHTEASRIAAEGKYSIVQKDGSGTHLIWKTEVPSEPGKVQKELSIGDGGSLAISIKNPKKANPSNRNVGLDNKADYGDLQKLFDGTPGGYSWIAVKDAALLDHVNCEILLIGANPNIKESLGEKVEEKLEEKVEKDKEKKTGNEEEDEEEQLIEEMKKELNADKLGLEEAPAAETDWK